MSDVIQTLPAFLAEPLDATSTQFVVKGLKDSRGRPITSMIGNILYGTIEPTSQNNQEIVSFTNIVDLGNNLVRITGVTRNLNPIPPHTALTADVPHGSGATIIITDTPQFWNERAAKDKNENVTGVWEFTGRPFVTTDANATDPRQLVTKGELSRTAFGTPTISSLTVGGTAGQNVTARQVVWLDETVGTWKLADGATLSEVNGTKKLGIALSTTTSGNPIVNGVHIIGYLSGFSGLSVGLVYVNDAGNVSNTPGTNSRPIGVATSATEIIFDETQATQLSKAEKDALVGTFGTPSAANPFVTSTDVVEAATASRIPRRRSTGDITVPTTPTNSTDATSKEYVDSAFAETVFLGESFTGATTPQPAFLVNDIEQLMVNGVEDIGRTFGLNARIACRIIPRATITSTEIIASVAKVGSPSDNIVCEIQTDSSSNPSGTVITNGTSNNVTGASLSTSSANQTTFTFASAFTLVAGTTYWVVFRRTGSLDGSNYYFIASSSLGNYASFVGRIDIGAGWASGEMPTFQIRATTGGSITAWQSDANSTPAITQHFHGFITTTGNAGDSATFRSQGIVSGFSSLVFGSDYSVSTTKGAITRGSTGQNVGVAISATQIRVKQSKNLPPIEFGTIGGTGTSIASVQFIAPFDGHIVCRSAVASGGGTFNSITLAPGAGNQGAFSVPVQKGVVYSGNTPINSGLNLTLYPQI